MGPERAGIRKELFRVMKETARSKGLLEEALLETRSTLPSSRVGLGIPTWPGAPGKSRLIEPF